jgi:DNA-binding NarL/FixJ family response regulator
VNPVRLVVADEHVLLRTALAATLDNEPGLHVVGQADDSRSAVATVARCLPQALLLSSTLPGRDATDVCGTVATQVPGCRILVLSAESDHSTMLDAFETGAHGYFAKDVRFDALLAAIDVLMRGEAVVPPHMLGGLLHELVATRRREHQPQAGLAALSRREREVLTLLAGGQAQEAIARQLVISPQTARTHIQNVIRKLGVHSRVEAVAVAIERGLIRAS